MRLRDLKEDVSVATPNKLKQKKSGLKKAASKKHQQQLSQQNIPMSQARPLQYIDEQDIIYQELQEIKKEVGDILLIVTEIKEKAASPAEKKIETIHKDAEMRRNLDRKSQRSNFGI